MRREELWVSGGLILVIALGSAFHFVRKPEPARPILSHVTSEGGSAESRLSPGAATRRAAFEGKQDINTATRRDLMRVQGIGEVLASAIVAYRDEHGPFQRISDIGNVPGVGEKRLESIRTLFEVPGENTAAPLETPVPPGLPPLLPPAAETGSSQAPPLVPAPLPFGPDRINVNVASARELEALPGVGPVLAERIVEWRTANGPFRTLGDLEKVSGIGPAKLRQIAPLIRVDG